MTARNELGTHLLRTVPYAHCHSFSVPRVRADEPSVRERTPGGRRQPGCPTREGTGREERSELVLRQQLLDLTRTAHHARQHDSAITRIQSSSGKEGGTGVATTAARCGTPGQRWRRFRAGSPRAPSAAGCLGSGPGVRVPDSKTARHRAQPCLCSGSAGGGGPPAHDGAKRVRGWRRAAPGGCGRGPTSLKKQMDEAAGGSESMNSCQAFCAAVELSDKRRGRHAQHHLLAPAYSPHASMSMAFFFTKTRAHSLSFSCRRCKARKARESRDADSITSACTSPASAQPSVRYGTDPRAARAHR